MNNKFTSIIGTFALVTTVFLSACGDEPADKKTKSKSMLSKVMDKVTSSTQEAVINRRIAAFSDQTASKIVEYIPQGTYVEVVELKSGWAHIQVNGEDRWVYSHALILDNNPNFPKRK